MDVQACFLSCKGSKRNINKMHLKKIRCDSVDWNELMEAGVWWRAPENTVLNHWVL